MRSIFLCILLLCACFTAAPAGADNREEPEIGQGNLPEVLRHSASIL
ncbi:MAG: hypothetical protein ACLPX9_03975 [Rhodomicrobium sp.]